MPVKGSFKDISFAELLQLLHLSRKTGRIEVTLDKRWVMVVVREGTVWHVEPRGFQGATADEVIYQLVALQEGNFLFQRVQVLPTLDRTVTQSTESLILEGTKRLDDQAAMPTNGAPGSPAGANGGGGGGASPEQQMAALLRLKPGAEAKVRYVPQNVKKVLQVIDGTRSMSDVIKQSGLEAAQATQIIKELIGHDILEAVEPPKPGAPPAA